MQRAKRVADDDARVEPIVADEESRTRGAGPGLVLLLVVFLPVAVAVFSPGLSAPFISDDFLYIVNNPYVREFEPATIPALFDPTGDAIYISGGNYAPIHLLTHAAEWRVFGEAVRAFIVPTGPDRLTAQQIHTHCLKQLPNYKIPQQIDFLAVMPKTANGKVAKEQLKQTDHDH